MSDAPGGEGPRPDRLGASDLEGLFAVPRWLRDAGRAAWLLVGLALLLVGVIWVLGLVSTIVEPMLTALVVAAVASPAVAWLQRHRVPRAAGALLILLGAAAFAVLVVLLVVSGIVSESSDIRAALTSGVDTITGWLDDAGVNGSGDVAEELESAVPDIGQTLIDGVMEGISGLTSLVFFLSFTALGIFFMLKDGPSFRRTVSAHMGVPPAVGRLVTGEVLRSLRGYFFGVTLVALFNAVVIGGGAWLLGVSLAGTIAVVTFTGAYIPYLGAVVSGAFAVIITLSEQGQAAAGVMIVLVILGNGILQQVVQPFAFGATLDLNPLVVLIATISGGALFGLTGLVLAAPLVSAGTRIGSAMSAARREAAATGGPPGAPAEPGGT